MLLTNLKHKARESFIAGYGYVRLQQHCQRASSKKRPIIFFPDQMYSGTAGDLRACAIAKELRKMGWRTIIVPPWLDLEARQVIIQREPSALLFLQQSRHKLNSPSLYPSSECIYDADDADILNAPSHVIECLRGSAAVIAGSHFLAEQFRPYNQNVSVVWTGTYITEVSRKERVQKRPIIAWAQSDPFSYPEEAELVKNIWLSLARRGEQFAVAVYSNDRSRSENWLASLTASGIEVLIRPRMSYQRFVSSLSDVSVGLQPICPWFPFSRGKSFGKVLAYMAARVPVVASDEIDHRLFFKSGENALLANRIEDWIRDVRFLLQSPSDGARIADAAHKGMLNRLTSRRAAEMIERVLERI